MTLDRHDALVQRVYGVATGLDLAARTEWNTRGAGRADVVIGRYFNLATFTPICAVEVKVEPSRSTFVAALSQARRYGRSLNCQPWVVAYSFDPECDDIDTGGVLVGTLLDLAHWLQPQSSLVGWAAVGGGAA